MRFGTLNVGSMTGRGRAIADLMKSRNVDVLCVQETKWSGNKAKELGDGYKLIYSGAINNRNGVGIILLRAMKDLVIEVNRKNDRILWLKLAFKDFTINIFSVYAPQSGCSDEEKDKFWTDLQEEMEKVEDHEKCMVNGDLNGRIGRASDVISRVHGGTYFGEGSEAGERAIDFAITNDLVIRDTIFKKRPEHLITYKSGNRASQIDFILYRKRDQVEKQNCKVIPGDVTTQHRLLTLDVNIKVNQKQTNRRTTEKGIKWSKLGNSETKTEFREKVLQELERDIDDDVNVEEWWNRCSETMLRVGQDVLGENNGKILENKESWWFMRRSTAEDQAEKGG